MFLVFILHLLIGLYPFFSPFRKSLKTCLTPFVPQLLNYRIFFSFGCWHEGFETLLWYFKSNCYIFNKDKNKERNRGCYMKTYISLRTISKISLLFWEVMQRRLGFSYRSYGTTCRSHLEGSCNPIYPENIPLTLRWEAKITHILKSKWQKFFLNMTRTGHYQTVSFGKGDKSACLLLSCKNRGTSFWGY
jgi:hypothetical protein